MQVVNAWTQENVSLLKEWWEGGLSSGAIEKKFQELGYPITRNAVIGKVHRLKIKPPEAKQIRRPPVRNVKRAARAASAINRSPFRAKLFSDIKKGEPIMIKEPDPGRQVLLRETKDGHCRAIIGYRNGVLADAICCGNHAPWIVNSQGKIVQSPWCDFHRKQYIVEVGHGRVRGRTY